MIVVNFLLVQPNLHLPHSIPLSVSEDSAQKAPAATGGIPMNRLAGWIDQAVTVMIMNQRETNNVHQVYPVPTLMGCL